MLGFVQRIEQRPLPVLLVGGRLQEKRAQAKRRGVRQRTDAGNRQALRSPENMLYDCLPGSLRWLTAAMLCALLATPLAQAQDADALKARHGVLQGALANNAFQRPLFLESKENADALRGDIYARIDQPFAVVGPALQGIAHWCEILILHLNVKRCLATPPRSGDTMALVIGRKFNQALAEAYAFEFAYKVVAAQPGYLQVQLHADEGPLGTSRYRIVLEIVALDAGRSFLHLSYAYGYGMAARLAMQGYLATLGRAKVGFSVIGSQANGEPIYIGSTRGVIERNTMRYYLAIEAYLGALATPASQRLAKRLNDWHSGVERYPVQLHELSRDEYLSLKRDEVQRQKALGG